MYAHNKHGLKGDFMKIKLKDKKMDRNYGLMRIQMKRLNSGETVEVAEVPKTAMSYVEIIDNKKKKGE